MTGKNRRGVKRKENNTKMLWLVASRRDLIRIKKMLVKIHNGFFFVLIHGNGLTNLHLFVSLETKQSTGLTAVHDFILR